MNALCLGQVNQRRGRFGESDSHENAGKDVGDFTHGMVKDKIVVGHERSPLRKTTHNDLRLAVETLSGGIAVNYIRVEVEKCPAQFSD